MKIFAFADSHGSLETAKCILQKIEQEDPDSVLTAGDFTLFGDHGTFLLEALKGVGKPFLVVPGNHERGTYRQMLWTHKWIIDLHEKVVECGGLICAGVGFLSFTAEDNDELFAKFDRLLAGRTLDVFASHEPPFDTELDGLQTDVDGRVVMGRGSKLIRRMIERFRPRIAFSGHLHIGPRSGSIERTQLVNPGFSGGIYET